MKHLKIYFPQKQILVFQQPKDTNSTGKIKYEMTGG